VGYFVLGPSDLYKLVKEIGSSIQSIRTLGTDLSTTLESNMESQLQLEDLRKAQRELTDAFSFRRSINIDDQEAEAFSTNVATPRGGKTMGDVPVAETVAGAAAGAAGAAATATGATAPSKPTKKKKIRRRKIVREVPVPMEGDGQIPDLDMSAAFPDVPTTPSMTPEEEAIIEQEFDKYTMNEPNPMSEWYDEAKAGITPPAASTDSMETAAETQSRFQQQLSGTWNEQVLANGEPKTPLASVMELLAILEQEKNDADKRIEEEFAERAEMKEQFYQKQRRLLEDAAAQMQQADYVGADQKTE
jgi:Sec-independent protein translocase protein TatA